MTAPDDVVDHARTQVALASRALAVAGQSDMIWGHVSVRDPLGRGAWLKAAGWGLEEVDADRVTLVDFEGELLEGDGPRHTECFIHTRVMAARPDVGCVVHTHAAASVTFAALGEALRPVSHEGTLFVPPDLARYTGTSGLVRTVALGDQVARELGERNALLLPGHGVVVAGEDVARGVMHAVLLDRACRLHLDAAAAGGPRVWTGDDEAVEKRAMCWPPRQLQGGWDYLVRRAAAAYGPLPGPAR